MKRKLYSLMMAVTLVLSLFGGVFTSTVAYSGYDYIQSRVMGQRLEALFKEFPPNSSYFKSTPNGMNINGDKTKPCNRLGHGDYFYGDMSTCGRFDWQYQCHAYAVYSQYILFGKTENGKVNASIEDGSGIKYSKLSNPTKEQIMKLPAGTHVRNNRPQHSVIVLSSNTDTITYIDCNCAEKWGCAVHLHEESWSFFFSRNGIGGSKINGYASYPTPETYPRDKPFGSTPFLDIADHWANKQIESAYLKKMVKGTSETEFAPEGGMNRAMFVQMLYNLEGNGEKGECSFEDVHPDAWYYEPIAWAFTNKVVEGMDEAHFAPNSLISREQAVTVLFNYYWSQRRAQEESITAAQWSAALESECFEEEIQVPNDGTQDTGDGESINAEVYVYDSPDDRDSDFSEEHVQSDIDIQADYVQMPVPEPEEPEENEENDSFPEDEKEMQNTHPLDSLEKFTDADIVSDWAKPAMAWAIDNKIISGRTPASLAPMETLKRAESVIILLLDFFPDENY